MPDPTQSKPPRSRSTAKPDIAIIQHKTDAMRAILLRVSRAYTRYTTGTIHPKKAKALELKFTDRYEIDRSNQQRYRMKTKGIASSHLVMWQESETEIRWWLLVTAGNGDSLVEQLETLQDATGKKTRIELTGYELVKTPRKGSQAQWSWRMTAENVASWEERIQTHVRHKSEDKLRQDLYSLSRVPGFSESRKQAYALIRLAEQDWQRTQKGDFPIEKKFIPFVGRYKKVAK